MPLRVCVCLGRCANRVFFGCFYLIYDQLNILCFRFHLKMQHEWTDEEKKKIPNPNKKRVNVVPVPGHFSCVCNGIIRPDRCCCCSVCNKCANDQTRTQINPWHLFLRACVFGVMLRRPSLPLTRLWTNQHTALSTLALSLSVCVSSCWGDNCFWDELMCKNFFVQVH